ncbi:Hypothetical predicted protein [Olea europaea subsp. europaea]|uniref:Uncharacterized protein n=1 Tax=Olea europaea subsp. europaea TaxID=158383 RepID=A0A8S0QGN6_OLEEU|nr:Hypothetical predicted protein [Olea europaea subsp. europaea]
MSYKIQGAPKGQGSPGTILLVDVTSSHKHLVALLPRGVRSARFPSHDLSSKWSLAREEPRGRNGQVSGSIIDAHNTPNRGGEVARRAGKSGCLRTEISMIAQETCNRFDPRALHAATQGFSMDGFTIGDESVQHMIHAT